MKAHYALETEHLGIKMFLIGSWMDLAAYYVGTDGNAWLWHACTNSWANEGPALEFKATFKQRRRGELKEVWPIPA